MKRRRPKYFVPAALGVGLLLLAIVGWVAFVSPQRTKASSLQGDIESTRNEIAQNRALSRSNAPKVAVRLADVFRLTKAMPDGVDMPGILLELNRVAGHSGISFESISPQAEASVNGYQMLPIEVVFTGNYYELSDFLYRVRNLVEVHRGELAANGRLFTVDAINFVEGPDRFPQLQATMTVNAFVYGSGAASGGVPSGATPTTTGTTAPQPSPTPPAPSSGTASAAGATQ
jgi:hypothetical protein